MRHRIAQRKLNRTTSHRRALHRNLAQSLFEHGQIKTTLAKAKDLRPFAEKLITLARRAKEGSNSARTRLLQLLGDRGIIAADHRDAYYEMSDAKRAATMRSRSGRRHRTGEPKGGLKFTAESVYHRLVNTIAPKFDDRPGGYTRIVKLGKPRLGDGGVTAVLQLVGEEESPGSVPRPEKTARRRRTDRRYQAAARLAKGGSVDAPSKPEEESKPEEVPVAQADDATPPDTGADESSSDGDSSSGDDSAAKDSDKS